MLQLILLNGLKKHSKILKYFLLIFIFLSSLFAGPKNAIRGCGGYSSPRHEIQRSLRQKFWNGDPLTQEEIRKVNELRILEVVEKEENRELLKKMWLRDDARLKKREQQVQEKKESSE